MPHIEFTVEGPPVSHQSKNKPVLTEWKKAVRRAATAAWGDKPPLLGKLKCTIMNVHEGEDAAMDDDNMVKPIRDALTGLVYADDGQITYSETILLSIDAASKLRRASMVVLAAYNRDEPFVYVRIEDAPAVIQLPR